MAIRKSPQKRSKIFISWSGENSKIIAREIKIILEDVIFKGRGLNCFVSDVDIASGADWWNKIKGELMTCKLGILCVTKENVKAPWLYYESGAMVARNVPTIPLLINCSDSALDGSPLKSKQCVDFYDQIKFIRMIRDINNQFDLLPPDQMDAIAKDGYEKLKLKLTCVLKELKNMRLFNEKYIYPDNILTVKVDTVYICAPMASIDDAEYKNLRKYLLTLDYILKSVGFRNVYCPIFDIEEQKNFDGNTKAINNNFMKLKQVDSMLIIYPKKAPSSILVELGYGIALCKRMVVFYGEGLPFMLEDASGTIKHIKTFCFKEYEEITDKLRNNGMDLFGGRSDE
jgi:hypothetical protein